MCELTERFENVLKESRVKGFMVLDLDDRVFLMEQGGHIEECEDCMAVWKTFKETQ
jgi:hypothetical protein